MNNITQINHDIKDVSKVLTKLLPIFQHLGNEPEKINMEEFAAKINQEVTSLKITCEMQLKINILLKNLTNEPKNRLAPILSHKVTEDLFEIKTLLEYELEIFKKN